MLGRDGEAAAQVALGEREVPRELGHLAEEQVPLRAARVLAGPRLDRGGARGVGSRIACDEELAPRLPDPELRLVGVERGGLRSFASASA